MLSEKEIFIRLLVAALLGGLIGWEREVNDRPAGFRTHILVSVGSSLIMIVSLGLFFMFEGRGDPGRIAAQVVSGIGFLGAGTIIREGVNVKGLTTAASLWTVAGIGLAAGSGLHFSAFVATGLVFVTLIFLNKVEFRYRAKGEKRLLEVRAIDRPGLFGEIGNILGEHHVNIVDIGVSSNSEDDLVKVKVKVRLPQGVVFDELNEKLYQVNGVTSVEWRHK